MNERSPAPPPPHPSRPIAIACAVSGVVAIAWSGGDSVGVATGACLLGLGAWQWRLGLALQLLNASSAALNRGDVTSARELLASARARHSMPFVQRFLDLQEVAIAWFEGDLGTARRAVDRAGARRMWFAGRAKRAEHRSTVDGWRALISALLGDEASAIAAVGAVRASGWPPRPMAQAGLAHAILLARRGEHDALRTHLAHWHLMLIEATDARGRALHRALRRLSQRSAASAYRLPAEPPPPAANARGTAEWLSRVFPDGAGLVEFDDGHEVGQTLAVQTDGPAPSPIRPLKRPSRRRVARMLAMLLTVPATFAVLACVVFAMRAGVIPESVAQAVWIGVSVGLLAGFVGLLVFILRRARGHSRELAHASALLLTGELDRAEAVLERVREHENTRIAACASLLSTEIFLRRADLGAALAECERGMGILVGGMQSESFDDLMPSFVANRAMLLAALGRDAESEDELVRLSRVHPTFAGGPAAVLSTRLVRAMRSGDLALARELARVRSDVGIGAHGEVLAELALADAADDRDDRLGALREELSAMPSLDRWARTVAPALLGRRAPEP